MTSFFGWLLLSGLLVIFILSNVAAIILGKPDETRTRRAIPWLQRSTSLQLAAMAWLFWLVEARDTAVATFSILIAAGMTVSFAADLIMAGAIRAPDRVLGGMIVFGLAHLIYIAAYYFGAPDLRPLSPSTWVICVLLMGAVGVGLWNRVIRGAPAAPVLKGASLVYTLLLGTMVAASVAATNGEGRLWLLPLGAILFMISDTLLSYHIFRHANWPYVHEIVWLTYIAGQACIVWSNYQALAVARSVLALVTK